MIRYLFWEAMLTQIHREQKLRELENNFTFFESVLEDLQKKHDGEFALIRHQKIIDFYPSLLEAQIAAIKQFSDRIYSIQEVNNQPVDLRFLNYAARTR